jgi:hypothetical protein
MANDGTISLGMIFNVVSQARGSSVGHSPLRGPKTAHKTRFNDLTTMREREFFNGSRAYEIDPTTPHECLGDPSNYYGIVIIASLLLASRPLAPVVRLSHVEIDSRCRGERETNTGDQPRQTTRVLAPSTLALVSTASPLCCPAPSAQTIHYTRLLYCSPHLPNPDGRIPIESRLDSAAPARSRCFSSQPANQPSAPVDPPSCTKRSVTRLARLG